ncbi:hypothetical protein OIU74_015581 [Salix koriyanagi]|uniref:Uncharacterized protein n=1 Tax=Salix koriyanagi TaxID=2511006 RepID=A0A9Q0PMJ9_9ROSI|nr:hypothetical protein OIU74_015581 [Salix koriyanagi]
MRMNLILSKLSLVTIRDGWRGKIQSFREKLERKTKFDSAYKRDPRILRRKEEGKAEKQRKKEAKFFGKKGCKKKKLQGLLKRRDARKKRRKKNVLAESRFTNVKKLKEKEKKRKD